jgi:hypothetical protein
MANVCAVEGCGKPARTRGWCFTHYNRWWRHGDVGADRVPGAPVVTCCDCGIVWERPPRASQGGLPPKRCPACTAKRSSAMARDRARRSKIAHPHQPKFDLLECARCGHTWQYTVKPGGFRPSFCSTCETQYKWCTSCSEVLPLDRFYRDESTRSGRMAYCKQCTAVSNREWCENNPGFGWRRHLKKQYGLTENDYQQMLAKQQRACALCQVSGKRLHVDHDHATGRVRGLLCSGCNMALGKFRDSPELLLRAARYVS